MAFNRSRADRLFAFALYVSPHRVIAYERSDSPALRSRAIDSHIRPAAFLSPGPLRS